MKHFMLLIYHQMNFIYTTNINLRKNTFSFFYWDVVVVFDPSFPVKHSVLQKGQSADGLCEMYHGTLYHGTVEAPRHIESTMVLSKYHVTLKVLSKYHDIYKVLKYNLKCVCLVAEWCWRILYLQCVGELVV